MSQLNFTTQINHFNQVFVFCFLFLWKESQTHKQVAQDESYLIYISCVLVRILDFLLLLLRIYDSYYTKYIETFF